MTGPVIVGMLVATAVYLIMQRGIVRIVLGLTVLTHGAHVMLLLAGGLDRRAVPFVGSEGAADPLPQAFALTSIVISFGVTGFLLALAYRAADVLGDDDTERERPADPDGQDAT